MVNILAPRAADRDKRLAVPPSTPPATLRQGFVAPPTLRPEALPLEDPVVGGPLFLLEAGVPERRPTPNSQVLAALLVHHHVTGRALQLEPLVALAPAVLVGCRQVAHGTALVAKPVVRPIHRSLHPLGHVGERPARVGGRGGGTPPLDILP